MREIKFRAWLPGIEKMTYAHSLEELMGWNIEKWTHGTAVWMQYTGLKDRNGKEIYESDIVKLEGLNGDVWIVFIDGYGPNLRDGLHEDAEWYDNGDYYQGAQFDLEKAEVIGNIYENKELIP